MSRVPYALTGLVLATALAGCSSGPDLPEASAFAEGTCRTAAPDVRAVGELLPRLGDGGDVEEEVKDGLREAQTRLRAVGDGAEPALKPAFDELSEKLGIVRIRADGNTYEPELGELLATAYDDVVDVCTDPAG